MTAEVTILFGGDGNEHRVSVASAQNVARHLAKARLWYWSLSGKVMEVARAELLAFEHPFERDFDASVMMTWQDLESALDVEAAGDAVFFLALHGGSGEDGTVQEWLERRRIPFTGSGSPASRLAFDKARARDAVADRGVRVATACIVNSDAATHERLARLHETHGKVVVKPIADGSSHGIRFIETERELNDVIAEIRRAGGADHLAEAFIPGRELTVGVIEVQGEDDGPMASSNAAGPHPRGSSLRDSRSARSALGLRALPCSEVRLEEGRTFDYEGKYLGKGTVELTPAPVSEEIARAAQEVALTAHEVVGCSGYSRTDVIIDEEGPVFLEINTLPGLTAASFIPQQLEAAGVDIADFLESQIELARRRG